MAVTIPFRKKAKERFYRQVVSFINKNCIEICQNPEEFPNHIENISAQAEESGLNAEFSTGAEIKFVFDENHHIILNPDPDEVRIFVHN